MGRISNKVETELISEEADFLSLAPFWNPLLENSGSDVIFLTFEWLSTWWRYFGGGKELFVIIARMEDRIVGLAPLMLTRREGFRELVFWGEKTVEYKDFIIAKDCDRGAVLDAIFRVILDNKDWDIMRLDGFAEDSPNCALMQSMRGRLRDLRSVWNENYGVAPYVCVDQPWETYLKNLTKNFRHDMRRRIRVLDREKGPVVFREAKTSKEVESLVDLFIQQHVVRRKDVLCEFSPLENPVACDFYKNLAQQFFHKKWLGLWVLFANGEAVTIEFGFVYGGKFFYYMGSWNQAFAIYGVGKLRLFHCLENTFSEKLRELDMLVGAEPYKFDFKPKVRRLFSVAFFQKSVRGHFAEIWFSRIRPRIEHMADRPGRLQQVRYRLQRASSKRLDSQVSESRF